MTLRSDDMKKLMLVDGNSMLFRAYYATVYGSTMMRTSSGVPTNAVFGFLSMLQKALDKLSPNIQQAFDMSRNKNMTYREIAAEMDISPKTVESYISQALKTLREELKDYLPLLLLLAYLK